MTSSAPEPATVAAFDLDGTMTRCDTLVPFLFYVSGMRGFLLKAFQSIPEFLQYSLGRIRNDEFKERVLARFLGGMRAQSLEGSGLAFSERILPKLLRPVAVKRLEWHKRQKHLCVIVSASPDIYVKPWAAAAGFDRVICSVLETDADSRITGKLSGGNCFAEEKVRRLASMMGERRGYILYAYGDSRGDKELLAMADHAYYRRMPE